MEDCFRSTSARVTVLCSPYRESRPCRNAFTTRIWNATSTRQISPFEGQQELLGFFFFFFRETEEIERQSYRYKFWSFIFFFFALDLYIFFIHIYGYVYMYTYVYTEKICIANCFSNGELRERSKRPVDSRRMAFKR